MRLGRVLSLLKKHRHLSSTLKKYKKMKKNSNSGGNTTNVYVEYMQLDSIELSPLRDDLLLKGMNTPQPQRGQSPSNTHRQHEDESESILGSQRGPAPSEAGRPSCGWETGGPLEKCTLIRLTTCLCRCVMCVVVVILNFS